MDRREETYQALLTLVPLFPPNRQEMVRAAFGRAVWENGLGEWAELPADDPDRRICEAAITIHHAIAYPI